MDQDLRVIYAEYTLAATDVGHVNSKLMHYWTSIIQVIEADSKEELLRIAGSFPQKRARIDSAIERFVKASNDASAGKSMDTRELTELKALQARLEAYFASCYHTIELLEKRWQAASRVEAQRLRDEAELNAAKDAGSTFINVTLELDRLLEVVAGIAGEVRKEVDITLRSATMMLVGVSLALAILVLMISPSHKAT